MIRTEYIHVYLSYFGLTDKPFSIAPNPAYLYLSERHKEALAHLTFGLGDAGGFVLLTGEVGTGKTTVTRCMLSELSAQTQVAFVFNPALSELELLASICDELHIDYFSDEASLKNLTNKIQQRLIDNHQKGVQTMLVIDEAQHLSSQVLEQLRLLTNIETNQHKLLQIILVGQPELQQLLQRNELRQLAQRITARYHLLPLNQSQIFEYIQHRLVKAGGQRAIFDRTGMKLIYQLTGGIPRLINLLCDRSLLGAYAKQQMSVDKKILKQAALEVLPPQTLQQTRFSLSPMVLSFSVVGCITFGIALSFIF